MSAGSRGLGVVIPVLDERERLALLLDALDAAAEELAPRGLDVVVGDNGSTDGSWELLAAAAKVRPYLSVVRTCQPGPGPARTAAARCLAERWRDRDPSECWVVSCDADNAVDAGYVRAWEREIGERRGAALLAGSFEFECDPLRAAPGGSALAAAWNSSVAWSELCAGVVNPTGANHAVRLDALAQVCWYRQPSSSFLGPAVLVAGEDWDLGIRVRLARLGAVRVPITVQTSPRRFLFDPVSYLLGDAHEGPFRRVDSSAGVVSELPSISHAVSRRAVLHFLVKPVLLGLEVRWSTVGVAAGEELAGALRALHGAGLGVWERSRDEFIYGLLPSLSPLAGAVAREVGVASSEGEW